MDLGIVKFILPRSSNWARRHGARSIPSIGGSFGFPTLATGRHGDLQRSSDDGKMEAGSHDQDVPNQLGVRLRGEIQIIP